MERILDLDKELFLYLNSFHTPWLDPIMFFITGKLLWLPLYAFLLYLVIREFKQHSWIVLLGIALTILLTDQVTSGFMKPYFLRLRPSHEPSLAGVIHLVKDYDGGNYTGRLYGFASSHAANTFGVAIFFFLMFRNSKKWIGLLFLWATCVTYSRIYIGVHYPGDVLVGALIGILCGWIAYKLCAWSLNLFQAHKLRSKEDCVSP